MSSKQASLSTLQFVLFCSMQLALVTGQTYQTEFMQKVKNVSADQAAETWEKSQIHISEKIVPGLVLDLLNQSNKSVFNGKQWDLSYTKAMRKEIDLKFPRGFTKPFYESRCPGDDSDTVAPKSPADGATTSGDNAVNNPHSDWCSLFQGVFSSDDPVASVKQYCKDRKWSLEGNLSIEGSFKVKVTLLQNKLRSGYLTYQVQPEQNSVSLKATSKLNITLGKAFEDLFCPDLRTSKLLYRRNVDFFLEAFELKVQLEQRENVIIFNINNLETFRLQDDQIGERILDRSYLPVQCNEIFTNPYVLYSYNNRTFKKDFPFLFEDKYEFKNPTIQPQRLILPKATFGRGGEQIELVSQNNQYNKHVLSFYIQTR